MRVALLKLLAPVACIAAGAAMITAFDWEIGGWIALIGVIAFGLAAWWAILLTDLF